MAKFRPGVPVLALCPSHKVAAQVGFFWIVSVKSPNSTAQIPQKVSLYRAVRPVIVSSLIKEDCLPLGLAHARRVGLISEGSRVLIVSNSKVESFIVGEASSETFSFPGGSFAAP